jgi:hypothetical protein
MTNPAPNDDDAAHAARIAKLRERTVAAAYRAIGHLAKTLARDHETCVKRSCRRAHRCRGTLCLGAIREEA